MPRYTINQQGKRVRGELSAEQIEMSKENQRALAELVQAMPSGRLIRIVNKAKSDAFPEGCAYTALQHLKKKIGRVSAGNESELKKTFESEEILAKNVNPSKYVDVLLDIKDELYDKYKYIKTERDIADQLIKVLPNEFEHTRNKLRDLRRDKSL